MSPDLSGCWVHCRCRDSALPGSVAFLIVVPADQVGTCIVVVVPVAYRVLPCIWFLVGGCCCYGCFCCGGSVSYHYLLLLPRRFPLASLILISKVLFVVPRPWKVNLLDHNALTNLLVSQVKG